MHLRWWPTAVALLDVSWSVVYGCPSSPYGGLGNFGPVRESMGNS